MGRRPTKIKNRLSNAKVKTSQTLSGEDIKKLVADWGGFEKLVAELHATGDVEVEHNVVLTGKSGATRQVDVVIRHKQGLYEHLIIVECKYWNKRVGRLHVDALTKSVEELNASKGVFFSTVGFESGAITQAQHSGIDLFTVRLPTNREWGLPGRVVDFYLHIIEKSFSNISSSTASPDGVTTRPTFEFEFNDDFTPISKTPVLRPVTEPKYPKTLEEIFLSSIHQAAEQAWRPEVFLEGASGVRRFWKSVKVEPHIKVLIKAPDGILYLMFNYSFDLALKITQSRIIVDRSSRFSFVLAIDDHVRKISKTVSKEKGSDFSVIVDSPPMGADDGTLKQEAVFQNGCIMSVSLAHYFPFEEVSHLTKNEVSDLPA